MNIEIIFAQFGMTKWPKTLKKCINFDHSHNSHCVNKDETEWVEDAENVK